MGHELVPGIRVTIKRNRYLPHSRTPFRQRLKRPPIFRMPWGISGCFLFIRPPQPTWAKSDLSNLAPPQSRSLAESTLKNLLFGTNGFDRLFSATCYGRWTNFNGDRAFSLS
jgi:hypothetical protein